MEGVSASRSLKRGYAIRRLLGWAIVLSVLAAFVAPAGSFSTPIKLLGAFCFLVLILAWLIVAFFVWVRKDDKAPAWDEIPSRPPIVPEPPFKGGGLIGSSISDRLAKWSLGRLDKDGTAYIMAMAEMYDIGTKYTSKNPTEAFRWYMKAVGGGDPAEGSAPRFAKLRLAEMYEDGEGVERDIDQATRIYKTIPDFPSTWLHFAIAHVGGRGVQRDYVEAYRQLLLADKFRSMNAPSKKEIEIQAQSHRENRRHIRVRELMAILEAGLTPEQQLRASEAARDYWNAHR
jgi:Sel1 repeat